MDYGLRDSELVCNPGKDEAPRSDNMEVSSLADNGCLYDGEVSLIDWEEWAKDGLDGLKEYSYGLDTSPSDCENDSIREYSSDIWVGCRPSSPGGLHYPRVGRIPRIFTGKRFNHLIYGGSLIGRQDTGSKGTASQKKDKFFRGSRSHIYQVGRLGLHALRIAKTLMQSLTLLSSYVRAADSRRFLELFRYILVGSQLLNALETFHTSSLTNRTTSRSKQDARTWMAGVTCTSTSANSPDASAELQNNSARKRETRGTDVWKCLTDDYVNEYIRATQERGRRLIRFVWRLNDDEWTDGAWNRKWKRETLYSILLLGPFITGFPVIQSVNMVLNWVKCRVNSAVVLCFLPALAFIALEAFCRRDLNRVRDESLDGARELVEALGSWDSLSREVLGVIGDVEEINRDESGKICLEKLRTRMLNEVESVLSFLMRQNGGLKRWIESEEALDKYLDVYDVHDQEIQEALLASETARIRGRELICMRRKVSYDMPERLDNEYDYPPFDERDIPDRDSVDEVEREEVRWHEKRRLTLANLRRVYICTVTARRLLLCTLLAIPGVKEGRGGYCREIEQWRRIGERLASTTRFIRSSVSRLTDTVQSQDREVHQRLWRMNSEDITVGGGDDDDCGEHFKCQSHQFNKFPNGKPSLSRVGVKDCDVGDRVQSTEEQSSQCEDSPDAYIKVDQKEGFIHKGVTGSKFEGGKLFARRRGKEAMLSERLTIKSVCIKKRKESPQGKTGAGKCDNYGASPKRFWRSGEMETSLNLITYLAKGLRRSLARLHLIKEETERVIELSRENVQWDEAKDMERRLMDAIDGLGDELIGLLYLQRECREKLNRATEVNIPNEPSLGQDDGSLSKAYLAGIKLNKVIYWRERNAPRSYSQSTSATSTSMESNAASPSASASAPNPFEFSESSPTIITQSGNIYRSQSGDLQVSPVGLGESTLVDGPCIYEHPMNSDETNPTESFQDSIDDELNVDFKHELAYCAKSDDTSDKLFQPFPYTKPSLYSFRQTLEKQFSLKYNSHSQKCSTPSKKYRNLSIDSNQYINSFNSSYSSLNTPISISHTSSSSPTSRLFDDPVSPYDHPSAATRQKNLLILQELHSAIQKHSPASNRDTTIH